MARVFVCRDHVLDETLDQLADALVASGLEVTRGPATTPGVRLEYKPADYPGLFGEADVAMFSSRSLAPAPLLEFATRLRGVVYPTIGVETLDLDAAARLGLIVGHGAVPENYIGMAEATVMLMLNLRLQLKASEEVLRGQRPRPRPVAAAQHARMMRGSVIGLVGYGRIARAVVERLRPFGVTMLAYSPSTPTSHFASDVQPVSLEHLLTNSDIVGLFASAKPTSVRLIDERALGLMKCDAYLVNVARGELVDEAALAGTLRDKRIAGAALDVFQREPLPEDSPLRTLDNIILTPHMVGHTREVYEHFVPAALENIRRILRGDLPLYCKNLEVEPRWRQRLVSLEASRGASE